MNESLSHKNSWKALSHIPVTHQKVAQHPGAKQVHGNNRDNVAYIHLRLHTIKHSGGIHEHIHGNHR